MKVRLLHDRYAAKDGRAAISSRMMMGLHLLKSMYSHSDEAVCARWVENPYFQYFCGEAFFQHTFPIERSSMTHWCQRVGEDFCAQLVQESLRVAHQSKALKTRHSKLKLYSWHAPEVECIGKGKSDKPYEFGCKVSVTTSINRAPAGHFILHAAALHGRPYDGHTLNGVLTEMTDWTGVTPERVYVDRGYRGHNYPHKLPGVSLGPEARRVWCDYEGVETAQCGGTRHRSFEE